MKTHYADEATLQYIKELEQQRDELLAEMKKIGILTSFESGTVDAQVFDIARAAIAKVKQS